MDDTQDGAAVQGIDRASVTAWFDANVADVRSPLTFQLIAGGRSNLTYVVTDAVGSRWVLRRPPLGQVLATAHDMGREHRIISALGPTPVPVPAAVALCDDADVNGAPFYVMGFVDGRILRDRAEALLLTEAQRSVAGTSLVEVLAAIHAVDPGSVGLDDLGRHDGYIERQLKRWYTQFEASRSQAPDLDLPEVDRVHTSLSRRVPPQHGCSIVHGDYRLDNCMLGEDGTVSAVLDWEICTLGDPLADVGLLYVYWTDPGKESILPQAAPTALDGFPRRDEVLGDYASLSGRDLSDIGYYVAFGYWKLTCILAGVYARYAGGAMGSAVSARDIQGFSDMLTALAAATESAAAEVA